MGWDGWVGGTHLCSRRGDELVPQQPAAHHLLAKGCCCCCCLLCASTRRLALFRPIPPVPMQPRRLPHRARGSAGRRPLRTFFLHFHAFSLSPCSPADYLFDPEALRDTDPSRGTPLEIRETGFLRNPRTPAEVKVSGCVVGKWVHVVGWFRWPRSSLVYTHAPPPSHLHAL